MRRALHGWRIRRRYLFTHLSYQWQLLGPLGQVLFLLVSAFVLYMLYSLYVGISKASMEAGNEKAPRRMCKIPKSDVVQPPDISGYEPINSFTREELKHSYAFNSESDSMVFLHIQKTSGNNFIKFLKKSQPQMNTLFTSDVTARKSTLCDVHMDYARLQQCLDDSHYYGQKKRHFLVTMLRDPTTRYLSEWLDLHYGDPWLPMFTHCDCPDCSEIDIPQCIYEARLSPTYLDTEKSRMLAAARMIKNRSQKDLQRHNATIIFSRWTAQTLDQFISCPDNPAHNRQVRMLGNYDVITEHCQNLKLLTPKEIAENLMKTAKRNLKEMAYFGLAEYQTLSEKLFHKTFAIPKLGDVELRQSTYNFVSCIKDELSPTVKDRIKDLNSIDYKLYEYAKDLFFQRLKAAGIH